MKVDGSLTDNLAEIPTRARDLESSGYDGAFTFEGPHDPFLPVLLAAEHTERLELSTAIAVAFARNPMTLAQTAYDLQLASDRLNCAKDKNERGKSMTNYVKENFRVSKEKDVLFQVYVAGSKAQPALVQ